MFVIERIGLKTKKAIVAKYGEDVTFTKGKRFPHPLASKSMAILVRKLL